MQETLRQFFIRTPIYVYFIFIYILYVGIKYMFGVKVHIYKLIIIGLIFFLLSLNVLVKGIQVHKISLLYYFIFLLLGIGLGWLQFNGKNITIDKQSLVVYIPPNYSTLLILIFMFIVKYTFGVIKSVRPELYTNVKFISLLLSVSALSIGLFWGRILNCSYRFIKI